MLSPCHASLNQTCIMPCLCGGCLLCCLLLSGVASLVSFGFVPELWGFVLLRPFVFFMDSFFLPCGISGKMIIPSKSLLSLLCQFARSFALPLLRCLPFACQPPTCHVEPLTHHCPSKPLIGYVTALLSPSYSVVSCRWRLEPFLVGTFILLVGISLYCYVILMHLYTW